MNTSTCIEERKQKVSQGIDLLLLMLQKAGQKPFPRKIMTFVSNGQFAINSKEEMLQRFKESQFIDCRVNAYPKLPSGTMQPPNIIIIDIDVDWSLKSGYRLAKQKLNKT